MYAIKTAVICFISFICVCVLLCTYNGNADDTDETNMELIRICIRQFILQNSDNAHLSEFSLTTDSVKGIFKKQEEGIWFLGNWVVEDSGKNPVAYYSVHHTKAISSKLIIKLAKKNYKYEILKFEIQHIFRTYKK